MNTNITIGADPELFIINTKTNSVVSAVNLVPGTKDEPFQIENMPNGFGLQTDNILVEFTIPPASTKEAFINNIEWMKNYIREYLRNINPDYDILCKASMIVPSDQLQSEQAQEFGCQPDYNVYTECENPKPEGTKTNLRSAGCHIHIGYENPNIYESLGLIKYFDAYLGLPSIIIDSDTQRRTLYGKAGCFRLKPYGFEYRTLSSYMISDSKYTALIYDQIQKAIYAYNHGSALPPEVLIQKAINISDIKLTKTLIKNYNICAV